jgi:hypothetical protein
LEQDEEEPTPCEANSDDDQFTCSFCSEDFTNKDSLRLHMIRAHKHQMNKVAPDLQDDAQSNSSQSGSDHQPSTVDILFGILV